MKQLNTDKNLKQIKSVVTYLSKNPLALVATVGFVGAVFFSLSKGNLADIPANQLHLPATSPYQQTISGIGFIESSSRNIRLGTFSAGIVDEVLVKEGDLVTKGTVLLKLDDRSQQLQHQMDLHEKEAITHAITAQQAVLNLAKDQYTRDSKLKAGLKSIQEVNKSRYDFEKAQADLKALEQKAALLGQKIKASQVVLDKLSIKAPIDGTIFKIFARKGEYVQEIGQTPVAIMGDTSTLNVRIQIDENDAWRYTKGAKATACLRSNSNICFPLTFIRFEPFAAPKTQLSGDSAEKVDTRVIEMVYKLSPKDMSQTTTPLVVGQIMDVFIDTNVSG